MEGQIKAVYDLWLHLTLTLSASWIHFSYSIDDVPQFLLVIPIKTKQIKSAGGKKASGKALIAQENGS